jgi:hypothetical protein
MRTFKNIYYYMFHAGFEFRTGATGPGSGGGGGGECMCSPGRKKGAAQKGGAKNQFGPGGGGVKVLNIHCSSV